MRNDENYLPYKNKKEEALKAEDIFIDRFAQIILSQIYHSCVQTCEEGSSASPLIKTGCKY